MGRRQTLRITGPGLGQVELPVDEGVAPGGHIGGEDADLADRMFVGQGVDEFLDKRYAISRSGRDWP